MKKYRVNVNGTNYEVTLEVMNEEAAAPTVVAPAKVEAPVQPTPVASTPVVSASDLKINSPMPGTILNVNVSNRAPVKKGDVLFILEAMKMENEILSPKDGLVTSVHVSKGASVDSGALLCVIQ